MESSLQPSAEEALETPPAPAIDPHKLDQFMHQLRMEQHLVRGMLVASLAAVVGAAAWAAVTIATGYQIGYMAVAIGFGVGYALRTVGKGIDKIFGVMGALLALFGCVLGNFLSTCGFVAKEFEVGYLEVLQTLDYAYLPELMADTFSPMDVLFYGIALYQGYKISFRQITPEELMANVAATPAATA